MRRFILFFLAGVPAFLISCDKPDTVPVTYFDSLVAAQVNALSARKAGLLKKARIGNKVDSANLIPTRPDWENELDIFRQLSAFEKPISISSYKIRDGLKDAGSNLLVRYYSSNENVPVPELWFYYYQNFKNLKKIEAVYQEQNSLYKGRRKLSLEFDDVNGRAQLISYRMDGIQKMMLSDSVLFSIHGIIRH